MSTQRTEQVNYANIVRVNPRDLQPGDVIVRPMISEINTARAFVENDGKAKVWVSVFDVVKVTKTLVRATRRSDGEEVVQRFDASKGDVCYVLKDTGKAVGEGK